jgi:hypothetical protein
MSPVCKGNTIAGIKPLLPRHRVSYGSPVEISCYYCRMTSDALANPNHQEGLVISPLPILSNAYMCLEIQQQGFRLRPYGRHGRLMLLPEVNCDTKKLKQQVIWYLFMDVPNVSIELTPELNCNETSMGLPPLRLQYFS